MTDKKDKQKLEKILETLLQSEEKKVFKLPRGLVLAFTPQPSDASPNAGARLVWSRHNNHPSEVEDKIMETAVIKALHNITIRVVVAGPSLRTALKIKRGWGSTMMTWKWADTAVLWKLEKKERDRALEWLKWS